MSEKSNRRIRATYKQKKEKKPKHLAREALELNREKRGAIKKYINIPFKSAQVLNVLLNAHIIQYQSSF